LGRASGISVFGGGGRPYTRRIDSIEIVAPQLDLLRRVNGRIKDPALSMLLRDERIQHTIADGRAFLRRSRTRYDIIEADALLPQHAGAGNLYSVEYFELLRARLKPGGFAVTWTPTPRTLASLLLAFPHVLAFRDVAIGSETPIHYSRTLVSDRLSEPFTRDYYRRGDVNVVRALASTLGRAPAVFDPGFDRSRLTDVNRDLRPSDEFGLLLTSAAQPLDALEAP
jgi:spermidine synthase